MASRRLKLVILAGVCVVVGVLFLGNLANGSLWQDEAQTALIARTVLAHGIPLGSDGINFFSQELGAEYGPGYVWRWHTWFPFYLLAGLFALFGESTFIARLPFALFGIATVLVTYLFGKYEFQSQRGGVAAAFLLTTSVPFLILSRQCRYYSVAAFSSILALYAYQRLINGDKSRYGALFVAALTLSFQSHFLYFATLILAVLMDAMAFHRAGLVRVGMHCALSIGINLPWIIWISAMPYGKQYTTLDPSLAYELAVSLLRELESDVVPAALLIVPIALLFWRLPVDRNVESVWRAMTPLALFVVLTLVALALSAPGPFFRYLAPLIPVLCILMTWVVESAYRRHPGAGLAVLVGLVSIQPLTSFVRELTHEFEGPVDGIVRYLRIHAKPNELIAVTYEDLPIKFYTNLRVIGGLTGESMAPAEGADWIIIRKYSISAKDRAVKQYLLENVNWDLYERIVLDSPDTPFQNRESPTDHRFETAAFEDRVAIFRRIDS